MKQALILIFNFFKNPDPNPMIQQTTSNRIKWLLFLLILEIPFAFVAGKMQQFLFRAGLISSKGHFTENLMQEYSPFIVAALVIVLLPFLEEIIFRLPLRFKKINFLPLIIYSNLVLGYAMYVYLKMPLFLAFPIPPTIFVWLIIVLYKRETCEKWKLLFSGNFRIVFYSLTILFALMHLTNFQYSNGLLLFAPIVVLPQLIGGLFMGFLRIKQGFIWGFFLHALHNTIFMLPMLLMPENTPKLINQIDKAGYTFITTEGYYFNNEDFRISHPFTSIDKITPDEIVQYGEFKNIVAKFSHNNKRYIHFENSLLAKKKISVYFKNDSIFENLNASAATRLVFENLLKSYQLNSKTTLKEINHWELSVYDTEIFQSHCSAQQKEIDNTLRGFMGKNDTIKLVNTSAKFLAKNLEIAFDMGIKNNLPTDAIFSIEIPNDEFSNLNAYLKRNYGLKIEKKSAKEKVLVIY